MSAGLPARLQQALFGMLVAIACMPALAQQMEPAPYELAVVEQGRKIYVEGVLGSGAPLSGMRRSGEQLSGRDAACIRCHRASGMGSVEGNVRVAPISSRFMFPKPGEMPMANTDGIHGKALSQAHAAYSDEILDSTLKSGINISGRQLSVLMPQFALTQPDLVALRAYLSVLSRDYSPGVTKDVIHFATVITPDVSASRRALFKQMLLSAVQGKNTSTSPRKRYMTSAASFVTQSERRWDVDLWELSGPPESWEAQLNALYADKPVFALLSGLSEGTWAPMDAFCRKQQMPCWFPSVRASGAGESAVGLYFSDGLVLDAKVLAAYFEAQPARRVMQFYAADGAVAAATLRDAMAKVQPLATDHLLHAAEGPLLAKALQGSRAEDAMVLWLGPDAVLPLMHSSAPPRAKVYLAAPLWSDADLARLPSNWQKSLKLVYPYELPRQRQSNLAYLHAWLKLRDIPLVDEVLQSELFFSLNLMTDTLQDMIDNLFRDYLVERAEDNIGKRETSKAEQETRDRKALGRLGRAAVSSETANGMVVVEAADAQAAQRLAFGLGESYGTTVYPKLTLGPGQHFASRGAYVLAVPELLGESVLDPSAWIVP